MRELRDAVAAVASRRDRTGDELARLLRTVDRDGDPQVIAAAEELLSAVPPHVWLLLDVAVRRPWRWASYRPATVVERLPRGGSFPVGIVIAALQADGYVREAAVARLAALDDVLAVPALALRAADWVPRVRGRARSALERRLAEPSGEALVAAAAIAFALGERREGRWLADRVRAVFRDGPVEALGAGLAAADPRTRRAAYLTALAAGRLDLARMLYAAVHDPDVVTKVRCAEAAVAAAAAAGRDDLAGPLLASGTAAVRAEAVDALARGGDTTPAVAALTDRNSMVRAVAQAALRRAGSDPVERYRRLAAAPLPEPGALAGLGETGTAADAALIAPWLAHPRSRGRAEAVRALRRLGAAGPDRLAAMLTDPSGAVTRQVTMALRPWASGLDPAYLRALLAADHPHHIRTAAYRLLCARDIWTRLLTDLDLLADVSLTLRARARGDITSWLTWEAATTYAMPEGRTADEFARRLIAAEDALGAGRARELRFHLGLSTPPTA